MTHVTPPSCYQGRDAASSSGDQTLADTILFRLTKSRGGMVARPLSGLVPSLVPGCHNAIGLNPADFHGGELPRFEADRTTSISLRWLARYITILRRPTCSYIGIVSFHSPWSFPLSAVFPTATILVQYPSISWVVPDRPSCGAVRRMSRARRYQQRARGLKECPVTPAGLVPHGRCDLPSVISRMHRACGV